MKNFRIRWALVHTVQYENYDYSGWLFYNKHDAKRFVKINGLSDLRLVKLRERKDGIRYPRKDIK
jgi:hypothetical protein